RAVDPQPDPDGVGRQRPGVRPGQPVVLALEAEVPLAAPDLADHLDRLGQRRQRLPRPAPGTAVALHRIPERPGAEPQLDAAAAEQVEGGGGLWPPREAAA